MGVGSVGPWGGGKEGAAPLNGSSLHPTPPSSPLPALCFASLCEPALPGAYVSWQHGWQTPVGAVPKEHL